jgi:hypothetical protein
MRSDIVSNVNTVCNTRIGEWGSVGRQLAILVDPTECPLDAASNCEFGMEPSNSEKKPQVQTPFYLFLAVEGGFMGTAWFPFKVTRLAPSCIDGSES